MPRRRESAATPPTFQRDMPLPSHRKSPSFASMSSAAAAGKITLSAFFENFVKLIHVFNFAEFSRFRFF